MARIQDGFTGSRALVIPRSVVQGMEEDELCKELHITDIGYYPQAKFHYMQRDTPIKEYILLYCIRGEGYVSFNGNRFTLAANQVIIIPPDVAHLYGSSADNPWTIYWVHFKGNKAHLMAADYVVPRTIPVSDDSRISYRLELFEEVFRALELGYAIDNLRYATTCFIYFMGSLMYLNCFRAARVKSDGGNNDIVARSIHFMRDNLNRTLTIREISSYVKYSPYRYSTLFRQKTGYSPMNYFTRLKIQKACEFLDVTNMKSNQICQLLGFDDALYFSRVFSKIMGMSPNAFRNRYKRTPIKVL